MMPAPETRASIFMASAQGNTSGNASSNFSAGPNVAAVLDDEPVLQISSVSPAGGPMQGGTEVTITGKNIDRGILQVQI